MMRNFLKNRAGATAIEYAIIASIIFMAVLASAQPIGAALNGIFGDAAAGMASR